MQRILLAEDEPGIAEIERKYLESNGFAVTTAEDGAQALRLFREAPYDLVLLDLMLPSVSGEQVLTSLRAQSDVPIILVTAKVEESDRIAGFQRGADDYLTKPFSARELVERVKAVLRRTTAGFQKAEIVTTADGRVEFNFSDARIRKDGKAVAVTPYEYRILKALFRQPHRVFSREDIIAQAFGDDFEGFDRAIDTHIKNIRQKLEDDPRTPKYIRTIYGMGYRAGGLHEAQT